MQGRWKPSAERQKLVERGFNILSRKILGSENGAGIVSFRKQWKDEREGSSLWQSG
jgi:hypothetical protein